jgi:hypothetical protein
VLVGKVERVGGESSSLLALDQERVVVACVFPPSVHVPFNAISIHFPICAFTLLFSISQSSADGISRSKNVRVTAQIKSEERGFCATDMLAVLCGENVSFSSRFVMLESGTSIFSGLRVRAG